MQNGPPSPAMHQETPTPQPDGSVEVQFRPDQARIGALNAPFDAAIIGCLKKASKLFGDTSAQYAVHRVKHVSGFDDVIDSQCIGAAAALDGETGHTI